MNTQKLITTKNEILALLRDLNLAEPPWKLLQIFSLYRFFLCSTLLLLNLYHLTTILGRYNIDLFVLTISSYFVFSLTTIGTSVLKKPNYYSQVIIMSFVDILFITLLINCSGGISSGLSMLFIPVIAAMSVLVPGKTSFLLTAMASISILSEQTYSYLYQHYNTVDFIRSGLNGAILFTIAIIINILYIKLHKSEIFSKKLKILNSQVIEKIHIGVLVVDNDNKLQMLNKAATELLQINTESANKPINIISPEIANLLTLWHQPPAKKTSSIMLLRNQQLSAEFIDIDETSTLIFIEDLSKQAKKIQEMKLISVGRITSNIAHEIRNPLAAISNATDLLDESKNLTPENSRLLQIIKENTKRTNSIIENVLLLSQAKQSTPSEIDLKLWLNSFVEQFVASNIKEKPIIQVHLNPEKLHVYMDSTQLYQVITNLAENGLRYSLKQTNKPFLEFSGGIINGHTFLDIIDCGPGVAKDDIKYLFEPFFTTNNDGTGLGLYMARELCHANNAKLEYYERPSNKSHFRIIFANNNE